MFSGAVLRRWCCDEKEEEAGIKVLSVVSKMLREGNEKQEATGVFLFCTIIVLKGLRGEASKKKKSFTMLHCSVVEAGGVLMEQCCVEVEG